MPTYILTVRHGFDNFVTIMSTTNVNDVHPLLIADLNNWKYLQ